MECRKIKMCFFLIIIFNFTSREALMSLRRKLLLELKENENILVRKKANKMTEFWKTEDGVWL